MMVRCLELFKEYGDGAIPMMELMIKSNEEVLEKANKRDWWISVVLVVCGLYIVCVFPNFLINK